MRILKSNHLNIQRSIILSIVILVLFSCAKQTSKLSNEDLASLIVDMHISEVSLKRIDKEIQDSLKDIYLEKLEHIHKIDKEEIKYQVELLMEDRSRQSDVYTMVINRLQKMEKEIKSKTGPQKKK